MSLLFHRHRISTPVLIIAVAWGFAFNDLHAVDFVHDIVPVLQRNCVHCHGGREAEGDFSLNTRSMVLASGFVDLEAPSDSYLLELITSNDPNLQMPPPDRPRMSKDEIALFRRWIHEGLAWDADFTFAIESYEPPLRPRDPVLPPPVAGRDHPIDRILDQYLSVRNLERPESIDDATFLRRVSLDFVGLLPSIEQLEAFVADESVDKRQRLIDQLLGERMNYADHWLTFFNDLLRNDYSGTGFITGGRKQISKWLYESLLANKPFDQMARELIAPPSSESQGYIDGIKWRGEVSAGQTLPIQFSQSISQSFLGINMKCASCHDSFIDRWTLKDAYGLAAIYSNETLELHRCDQPTGETAKATWLFPELGQVDPDAPRKVRLGQLADLMTHSENGRFARTIVNRLWYQLMGRGIVHPLDAMQTKPWNEGLLDYLAIDFVNHGFDLKHTLRQIASSQAYQSRSEVSGDDAAGDVYVYRGPRTKRMTAEQFLDGIWQLTGAAPLQFDAPVVRSTVTDEEAELVKLRAQWIWGPGDGIVAAGQQRVLLRKQIELTDAVVSGGVVVTCDNEFQLFVNNKLVGSGKDWTKPKAFVISKHLKPGANSLHVIAMNQGDQPNPAGLYLEGRVELADSSVVDLVSDESWQCNTAIPGVNNNRLARVKGKWQSVNAVSALAVWENTLLEKGRRALAELAGMSAESRMVRASLLKNTALMKSLGRPMREQIVSMRPATVTTLEAIDLANESSLANAFAGGAGRLLDQYGSDSQAMVRALFLAALSREPSPHELQLITDVLGSEPKLADIQDAFWAVCMLPEFILIR